MVNEFQILCPGQLSLPVHAELPQQRELTSRELVNASWKCYDPERHQPSLNSEEKEIVERRRNSQTVSSRRLGHRDGLTRLRVLRNLTIIHHEEEQALHPTQGRNGWLGLFSPKWTSSIPLRNINMSLALGVPETMAEIVLNVEKAKERRRFHQSANSYDFAGEARSREGSAVAGAGTGAGAGDVAAGAAAATGRRREGRKGGGVDSRGGSRAVGGERFATLFKRKEKERGEQRVVAALLIPVCADWAKRGASGSARERETERIWTYADGSSSSSSSSNSDNDNDRDNDNGSDSGEENLPWKFA
uniref:Uncharacterized protein n=1 Tax=Vespula pensylvanica TaxID=30213 RepID=A0A834UC76_VESPE|nr:hypothetical protein H0235_006223 [Vespula pensylvanica]